MSAVKLLLILNIVIAVARVPGYAQTDTGTTTNSQPPMAETVREFDKLMSNADRLRRSNTATKTPKTNAPVLVAIPQFRKATADLRDAVGSQKSVRAPLQNLGKIMKPFSDYFKDLKLKSAEPDAQEFKSYSQKELVWETLTTAERVDNNLQIAGKLLRESNRTDVVTIQTLQFYAEIDSDLKRLKLLADKVSVQR